MNLTDDQERILTEKLLGECWHERPNHNEYCCCDSCLFFRKKRRTFTTAQDLMDCKEALVKKGLWNKFLHYAIRTDNWIDETDRGWEDWLFCTIDENGEAHFCRLVCDYLETIK